MHELLNTKTGKTILFPSELEELTPEQYIFFLKLALKLLSGEITDVLEAKRRLFVKLTNLKISKRIYFYSVETRTKIWSALADKINLMDSFFEISENETGQRVYRLRTESIKNMLPEWKGYRAPSDIFKELTWGDFVICMNAMKMLANAENEEEKQNYLRDIFYAIYKPIKAGKRVSSSFRGLGGSLILFHAHNYISYIAELITTMPVNINGEDLPIYKIWQDEDEDKKPKEPTIGWSNVLFSVAETAVFGNAENVNKQPFLDVLLFLYKQRQDYERQKRDLEKLKIK